MLICVLQPARGRALRAQEAGVAVITSPLEGAIVSGLVPLSGTATHPQFQRYELAFSYDPNSTGTWFSLQDPASTQVVNDLIGRWDTATIADGVYVLRLRVYWSDQDFLEAVVGNVRVQNATPTPAPATVETPATLTPAPVEITATPLIVLPPTPTTRPTTIPAGSAHGGGAAAAPSRINAAVIREAFLDGVRLTLIGFALLGAYAALRASLRSNPRR
ncbi:MAG: hypothetical protein ACRDH2_09605 [Anaerolineales bacterium]